MASHQFAVQHYPHNPQENCLFIEAEKGEASITVTLLTAPAVAGAQWTPTNNWCFYNQWARLEVTSKERQTFRIGKAFRRIHRDSATRELKANVFTRGYSENLCVPFYGQCFSPISAASSFPTLADATTIVRQKWLVALGIFLLGVIAHIGPYNVLASLLPTGHSIRARSEMRRSAHLHNRYDPATNEEYRKPARSWFRRKQDTDDLTDIVADAKEQLRQAKEELDQTMAQQAADDAAYDQAEAEFNESVRRAEAAQRKMEAARRCPWRHVHRVKAHEGQLGVVHDERGNFALGQEVGNLV